MFLKIFLLMVFVDKILCINSATSIKRDTSLCFKNTTKGIIGQKNETCIAANGLSRFSHLTSYDKLFLRTWTQWSQPLPMNYTGVEEKCKSAYTTLIDGVNNYEFWAVKMIDASAKIPSGLLSGNVNQYGHFDQCLEVPEAQYCLAEIDFQSSWKKEFKQYEQRIHSYYAFRGTFQDPAHRIPSFSIVRWGFCLPKECSDNDVKLSISNTLNANVFIRKNLCQKLSPSKSLTRGDYIARFILGGILVCAIFASLYSHLFDQNVKTKKSKPTKLLLAFSLQENWSKLIDIESTNNIRAVDGVRGLCALGLIVSHKTMSILYNPFINRTQMVETLTMHWAVMGRTAILYTEGFMLISGLLIANSILKDLKSQNSMRFFDKLITRIFRISPSIIATILFCTYILPKLGSGPLWPIVINHHAELCKSFMWRNFFYIHNYFGFENMCLTHSHQVGIDMQLFLATPIIIYAIWKNKRLGFYLLGFVALLSTIVRFVVTYKSGISHVIYFGITVSKMFDTANLSYILPTHRATIYLMGVVLAYALKENYFLPKNKMQATFIWTATMFSALLVFLGPVHTSDRHYQHNDFFAAMYGAFSPILSGIGFFWAIYAANIGYGGWFGDFLSWKGFRVFSKISYAVYLTQFPIFFYNVGRRRYIEEYSPFLLVTEVAMILIISTLVTLLVEMPFVNLKKIIFNEENSREAKKTR